MLPVVTRKAGVSIVIYIAVRMIIIIQILSAMHSTQHNCTVAIYMETDTIYMDTVAIYTVNIFMETDIQSMDNNIKVNSG